MAHAVSPGSAGKNMEKSLNAFSKVLNICITTGKSVLVDLVPEDGVIEPLSEEEEELLGRSIERICAIKVKKRGTLSRLKCDANTTPESLFLSVARALRMHAVEQVKQKIEESKEGVNKQQQQQTPLEPLEATGETPTSSNPDVNPKTLISNASSGNSARKWVHMHILQDIDKCSPRSLLSIMELLTNRTLSMSSITSVGAFERIQIPNEFILIATACTLPVPTPFYSLTSVMNCRKDVENEENIRFLPDRLVSAFLLRVPILTPSRAEAKFISSNPSSPGVQNIAISTATTNSNNNNNPGNNPASERAAVLYNMLNANSELVFNSNSLGEISKVFISPSVSVYLGEIMNAFTFHSLLENVPPPGVLESLKLALQTNAYLNHRAFVTPTDINDLLVDCMAHHLLLKSFPGEYEEYNHPVVSARNLVGQIKFTIPVLR